MKYLKYFFLVFLFGSVLPVLAQNPIPNAGFESWNGIELINWTHNSTSFIPTVVKTTDSYSGSFAVKGEVLDFSGVAVSPALFTGTIMDPRFIVTTAFQTFTGQYKYGAQGGDLLLIEVVFQNINIGGGAEGHAQIGADATSFTEVEIPMEYDSNNPPGWVPTHGNISITILPPTGQTPHVGTYFIIDHFTFDGQPVNVKKEETGNFPVGYFMEQNYPNPFNPSTNINFSLPEKSFVSLTIYNIGGEEIATLVNQELSAGNYSADWDASGVTSGVYMYVLSAKDFIQSRKMILLR